MNISQTLATELNTAVKNIDAVIALLDDGATVPFIARYRKESTGGLDDTQLRLLEERLSYLRELEERRAAVLKSIEEQGKLTDDLQAAIAAAQTKTVLEDLYLPYKPKRRTKAQIAREQGLAPLAEAILQTHGEPEALAADYLNDSITDSKAALDGARHILIEQFGETAALIGQLREMLWQRGEIRAAAAEGKEIEGEKFRDYFNHREALHAIPSHRALALLRGRNEGVLNLSIAYQDDDVPSTEPSDFERSIAAHFAIPATHKWLCDTVRLAWRAKIFLSLELEAFNRLKEQADADAITVFARNLKDLLLAAPAGRLTTLGLDPGYRNGVKCAVVDDTGKVLETFIVYLHQENAMRAKLAQVITAYDVKLIAIGNGTASRETDALTKSVLQERGFTGVHSIVISEAGASVYSASELAAKEFPDMDVSLRGAVSIARRLQDPLAELVKIDPKSIGVGQYQHDVNQSQLAKSLDAVVEDCVNAVGVDVNTASAPLLARIAGLNPALAANIVAYRDENGAYPDRKSLLKVPRLGPKTYEQAAGFLRINGGREPLDASAVHPETYALVGRILADLRLSAGELIGNTQAIKQIRAQQYTDERFGLPTVLDILSELEKPGRDPRGEFKTATFQEGIHEISDLRAGMQLEGVVTNVAAFGAFVDIGVHQDGLVHISMLADKYVSDPHEVVKAGDVVKVTVLEVDEKRKRISLSMKTKDAAPRSRDGDNRRAAPQGDKRRTAQDDKSGSTAMAAAFAALKKR